jgi:chorismate mutase/prephenate dehydratase
MTDPLGDLRRRIDELDRRLLDLLVERAETARAIGAIKTESGSTTLDPGRERAVLDGLLARNAGRFPPEALVAVFREIISASRALEAPMTVGYLGRPGGFAALATARRFGSSTRLVPYADPVRLFHDLEAGFIDHAVIAREVGDEDPALDHFDLFLENRVSLFGETFLRQGYALLGRPGSFPARTLYGHPAALARCRALLDRCPGAVVVATAGSREAVDAVRGEGEAALAPAQLAGGALEVLIASAEDAADPSRHFLILARVAAARSGRDRTAIVCVLPNRPGSLLALLQQFAAESVNVSWIETRESRRSWEHTFFVEVDGHREEEPVGRALDGAPRLAAHLAVLGSYPVEDLSASGSSRPGC